MMPESRLKDHRVRAQSKAHQGEVIWKVKLACRRGALFDPLDSIGETCILLFDYKKSIELMELFS